MKAISRLAAARWSAAAGRGFVFSLQLLLSALTALERVADAKSAVRWLRTHAVDFGIDAKRIAAGGGSAGGHLAAAPALVTGMDEKGEDTQISSAPSALALFIPVLDVNAERWRDRMSGRALEVSPLQLVRQDAPPAIIFHGTTDTTVPFKQAEDFCATMKQHGNRCELLPFEGRKHGFFNVNNGKGEDYPVTLRALDKFLVSLG